MSFREKIAWISLLTTVGVWGFYFARVVPALTSGDSGPWQMALFVECVVFTVIVQAVLTTATAIGAPREARAPADEREARIAGRATVIAYTILLGLVLCVACATPFVLGMTLKVEGMTYVSLSSRGDPTVIVANGILLAVVVAELVRSSATLTFYRLGRAV